MGYTPDTTQETYAFVTDRMMLGRSLLSMSEETPAAMGSGAVVGSKSGDLLNFYVSAL